MHEFFIQKLQNNGEEPLVEDIELPLKQRPSRPKLPASGKIAPPSNTATNTSPQKRPLPTNIAQSSSKAGAGSSEPSKKKAKKNNGTAADASSSMGPPGGDTLFGSSTTDGKSATKAGQQSSGVAVNGENSGVSDLVGEGSSGLAEVDAQQNKVNGTAVPSSTGDNAGNQSAGMMSPESINGQA